MKIKENNIQLLQHLLTAAKLIVRMDEDLFDMDVLDEEHIIWSMGDLIEMCEEELKKKEEGASDE